MRLNNLYDTAFLPGGTEAVAVDNHKYNDVHNSTVAKVNIIAELAKKLHDNKFRSHASFSEKYGTDIAALIDDLMASRWMKLLGLIGLIYSLLQIVSNLIRR